jgi:hypothetical protein
LFTKLLYLTTKFKTRKARCNGKIFELMVADSPTKKMLGLMHRKSLPENKGMLFLFNRAGRYDIWMLNMNLPIDILWLDSKSKVIKIIENAEPCSSFFKCIPYSSPHNAMYIIELNAGASRKNSIRKGSVFSFQKG